MYYTRQSIGPSQPRWDVLPRATIEAIERTNQLDLELYAYARDMFSQQIKRSGSAFSDALESFQAANKRIQPALKTYRAIRRVPVRQHLRQQVQHLSSRLLLGKSQRDADGDTEP